MLTIISLKLVSYKLAKVMVNWESAKRFVPNLYSAGESIFVNSLPYIQGSIPWIKSSSAAAAADNGAAKAASTEYLVYNWLEAMAAYIQMAMLWEDYVISLCAFSGIVGLFLLLTCFAPRFYATIMIALFVYNLIKVWFRHVWPEIRVQPDPSREEESRLDVDRWTVLHPNILTLAELKQLFSNLIKISELYLRKLLALRSKRPISFCLAVCSTLSCTAYIGNSFSGLDLLFWATYALFLAPGTYLYLLPQTARDYLKENFRNIIAQAQANEFETSPPPPTPSTLFELLKHLAKQESTFRTHPSSSSSGDTISSLLTQPMSSAASTSQIKSTIDNPTSPIQTPRRFETMTQVKEEDEEDSESPHNDKPRKSSDDLSSNGSASMIDFDEDQQDGFVIL